MTAAILGGLGASLCFSVTALCASAASRQIGATATLAYVMAIGLALVVPAIAISTAVDPRHLDLKNVGLLVLIGATNVAGLGIEYVAFRRGKVGVITPIVSTEGAIAALIALIAGVSISAHTGVALLICTIGVVLAAAHPDPPDPTRTGPRSAVLAMASAMLFGITLYTTGKVSHEVPIVWVLLPARLLGSALIAAPLAITDRLRAPKKALPLVAAAGGAEVIGIVSYVLGARHQLEIAAVLASQFAAFAAIGAYFAFGERLTRLQLAGLVVVAIGVALLAIDGA